ncbi:MAG: energy transducer TonB [Deltaproteobacteria bacterium]|nr:energy transducer TonB [Deltaproteobacteria bacterium]
MSRGRPDTSRVRRTPAPRRGHFAALLGWSVAAHLGVIAGLSWWLSSAPPPRSPSTHPGLLGFADVVEGSGDEGPSHPAPPPAASSPHPTSARKTAARDTTPPPAPSAAAESAGNDIGAGAGNGTQGNEGNGGNGVGRENGGTGGSTVLAAIRRRIERVKVYPAEARRKQLEGRPFVEFALQADGQVAYSRLVTSCGEALLDAAALDTIRRGAPYPYYAGPIRLAIRFSVDP